MPTKKPSTSSGSKSSSKTSSSSSSSKSSSGTGSSSKSSSGTGSSSKSSSGTGSSSKSSSGTGSSSKSSSGTSSSSKPSGSSSSSKTSSSTSSSKSTGASGSSKPSGSSSSSNSSKNTEVRKGGDAGHITTDTVCQCMDLVVKNKSNLGSSHKKKMGNFSKATNGYRKALKRYDSSHEKTVKKLKELLEDLESAKTAGDVVDTTTAAIGIITGGIATAALFTPIGPVVGGAMVIGAIAGLASAANALTQYGITDAKSKEILEILHENKECKEAVDQAIGELQTDLFDLMADVYEQGVESYKLFTQGMDKIFGMGKAGGSNSKMMKLLSLEDAVVDGVKGAAQFIGTSTKGGKAIVKSTGNIAKAGKVFGKVMAPVGLVVDSYTLFTSATDLSKGKKHELHNKVKSIIQGMNSEKNEFVKVYKMCQSI